MPIRVLIADDHAIISEGLRLILEANQNIQVADEATDGFEAIAKARKHKPDVVIMDIAMPNMNGIEATARIKEQLPETQVVILSMHYTLEDIFRALQAGAIAYILKESAGKEVSEAVQAAYNKRRYLSRKVDDILIDSYLHDYSAKAGKGPFDMLSPREREILQLITEGKTSGEMAEMLYLSAKTIETYRSRLMQKLGFRDVTTLIRFTLQQGWVK